MPPPKIVYFKEGLPSPHLQPDWLATSVSSGVKIGCYFANVYRAAPWPKSGGFCVFHNMRADAKSAALMLPDDLVITRPTPQWDEISSDGSELAERLRATEAERDLLRTETAQLRAVLSHPLYQANPIATIHDHLENSIKLSKV